MDPNMDKIAGLPLEEQETVISFVRSEAAADIWTSDRTMFTKLDRLCKESPDNYKCVEIGRDRVTHEILDKRYQISDKGLLSFRSRKMTVELSEEQKAERRKRIEALNHARRT